MENFTGRIEKNFSLKDLTTWKIGGEARYVFFPIDRKDVEIAVSYAKRESLPYFVMGNGSNILAGDQFFDGVIINLKEGLKEKTVVNFFEDEIEIYLGAGNLVPEIIKFLIREELTGLEFLAGIPATLGGLLRMNAGAFDDEIMKFVKKINFYNPQRGFYSLPKEQVRFGYRRLEIDDGTVILGASMILKNGKRDEIKEKISSFIGRRKEKQPLDLPSCGSVFKNPEGSYAGKIIEELGLKGYQVGGAKISEKHANFIVNTGSASAKDVLTLIELIKQKAYLKKGIVLKEEVYYFNINKKVRAMVL
ncbi:MAG: UDP-N-acetylmuramate dehydrogenase [Proteobacteria bacterium]|nr:UDP-N-acetylmuramate dehydrogenase [Pseudomonadota bacterium]